VSRIITPQSIDRRPSFADRPYRERNARTNQVQVLMAMRMRDISQFVRLASLPNLSPIRSSQ